MATYCMSSRRGWIFRPLRSRPIPCVSRAQSSAGCGACQRNIFGRTGGSRRGRRAPRPYIDRSGHVRRAASDNGGMKLRFTKMQGAGNDFVMINGIAQKVELSAAQYRFLADRHFGIGADQILLVQTPEQDGVDFRYRIFNADGGEVEQCGNGARCFVKFVHAQGLTRKRLIRVATLSGIIAPELQDDGEVTVDMGAPIFAPARVPFDVSGLTSRREHNATLWPLRLDDETALPPREKLTHWVCVLSMGNPHAVQVVADVDAAPVTDAGPRIENHARF